MPHRRSPSVNVESLSTHLSCRSSPSPLASQDSRSRARQSDLIVQRRQRNLGFPSSAISTNTQNLNSLPATSVNTNPMTVNTVCRSPPFKHQTMQAVMIPIVARIATAASLSAHRPSTNSRPLVRWSLLSKSTNQSTHRSGGRGIQCFYFKATMQATEPFFGDVLIGKSNV